MNSQHTDSKLKSVILFYYIHTFRLKLFVTIKTQFAAFIIPKNKQKGIK